jgi:hypothetical protein
MKEIRNFGLIWFFIFLVIAFLPIVKGHPLRFWALYPASIFLICACFYPKIFEITGFYKGWIKFGNFLGKINSKIIIAALFYLIFFPIGLILKITGKDLLNKKIDKSQESYFVSDQRELSDMKNQF